jgi:hypothetical protein
LRRRRRTPPSYRRVSEKASSKYCALVKRSMTMPGHSNQPENKRVQQKAVVQQETWMSVVKRRWRDREAEAAAQVYRRRWRCMQMGGGIVTRDNTTTSLRKIGGRGEGCWRGGGGGRGADDNNGAKAIGGNKCLPPKTTIYQS